MDGSIRRLEAPAEANRRTLVVLSHRLPARVRVSAAGRVELREASSGLAISLGAVHRRQRFRWIGRGGMEIRPEHHATTVHALGERGYVAVEIDPRLEEPYSNMCNSVLWPAMHYFVNHVAFTDGTWSAYVDVNQAFADAAAVEAPVGAHVWIHDYHLMLVPALLRARRPDLCISFFLHAPFPSSEIYRTPRGGRSCSQACSVPTTSGFTTGTTPGIFVRRACECSEPRQASTSS